MTKEGVKGKYKRTMKENMKCTWKVWGENKYKHTINQVHKSQTPHQYMSIM